MTLADDPQNPKPAKKPAKSMDAIAALREAMGQRVRESRKTADAQAPAAAPASPPQPETVTAPPATPARESSEVPAYAPAEWSRILFHIAERSQKLVLDYIERNQGAPLNPPLFDPAHLGEAFSELAGRLVNDPERFVDAHIALWQGYAQIWQSAFARLQGQTAGDPVSPAPADKRFKDSEWQSNWLFDVLKQLYLLTAQRMRELVQGESKNLSPRLARKLEFVTRQMADAISPSNFWMTNPEVLREIYKTGGESLIKGLENLLTDLQNGKGDLRIRMTDTNAFRLGENLAAAPGQVIYQNRLIQLIQYAPSTPDVYREPLLMLPPWINKFYILDLREKNSLVRYLVAQGYTVFCVSWVNPDARLAGVNFEDYMTEGALAAMREVMRAAGAKNVNMLGYCIGGTLLASTLAFLKALPKAPDDIPRVASATYLVTMTDFSEPGDLGAFVDEDLVRIAEERMAKQGYLDAASMAAVFNLLRSNDLIWSCVVNNYLLGKDPAAFDILYWNSDSTNMPAAMQRYYMREMYMANNLIKPNALTLKDVAIDLRSITVPSFLLSTREDHIAPWKSTYAATQIYKGPLRFVLASSGHIAGVINPPASGKYGYWTNEACPASPDDWLEGAQQHQGSWWPEWLQWLEPYAGDKVPARDVSNGLEDAPGSYVKVRAV